jgi:hypothetical protein
LRSEWTTWRPPYPSCTGAYPAHRLSAQDRTLPDVWSKRTTRNGGPEPAKRATNPRRYSRNGIPSARRVPRSGPTSQPKGRSNPSDSDQLPPERPGSQSDAAAARHHGAGGGRREYRDCVGSPRACFRKRTTRRGNHLSRNYPDSTPKAYRLGLETTTHQSAASGQRPGA